MKEGKAKLISLLSSRNKMQFCFFFLSETFTTKVTEQPKKSFQERPEDTLFSGSDTGRTGFVPAWDLTDHHPGTPKAKEDSRRYCSLGRKEGHCDPKVRLQI